ncbi:type II toxin-antitoxin system antitoxin DNA ADP-ribosyl glycohydrolase DarG [Tranquillimonas alkanivorans]|uniref:O-acetyl-ADP-ribose deacetylase (Regulator of RNase III), contains Macro domain n=1 Tax=Tranquillimonas alkanivorans TaxID=441119 RepID=A0A1I5TMD7_9RHOB|nr:macro domain-containing protein [Tranquillimonas alkanivorans]SFP84051.1 O-acetyl-ADP-ribose deacetylase (regulator of RNase III), contains Macro domain [Tranquillimonas alkanivorans]
MNCVGVMGRGIALQFKKAFPRNFEAYKLACDRGEVVPGKMFITERHALTTPRFIINFPTKRHWRGKSRIEDIESGLAALREEIEVRGIKSIAIPPLGSGLGGLKWSEVRTQIESVLGDVNIEIVVFEPGVSPDAQVMTKSTEPPKMTAGRATLVTLMHRYLAGLLDPFVTLIELHKLMYFMQEAGEPLRLNYKKHHYGPYAENLRHVLNQIEGHLVSGYADGGDIPGKTIELVPGSVDEADRFLKQHKDTNERFVRVSQLVDGFESPVGMELLATVHWLIQREGVTNAQEAIEKTYSWNDRKRRFTQRQISLAFDRLVACGWGTPNSHSQ